MKDEEMAKEIANNEDLYNIDMGVIEMCEIAALKMAEWKEQQMAAYININVKLQKNMIIEIKKDMIDRACRIAREKGYFHNGIDCENFRKAIKKSVGL